MSNDRRASDYANELIKKININDEIAIKIKDYVVNNFSGYNYPSLKLFLDGAGLADKREELFDYALKKLRWMSDSYTYAGKPLFLAIINDLGGIKSIQGEIFTEDKLNSYAIKGFKERFMRSYDKNVQKKELPLKLISTRFPNTAQVKKLDNKSEPVRLFQEKPNLKLIENVTDLVMNELNT